MTKAIRIATLVLLSAFANVVVQAQQKISGSYTMSLGGQPVSEEKFTLTINADGSITAEADLKAGANLNHIVTTATRTAPRSFELTVANQGGIKANFNNGSATIAITGQAEREVKTQASVLLENAVWHHFVFLLRQYDTAAGGTQNFKAFLPSQAADFQVKLEPIDTPRFEIKGGEVTTQHYRATTSQGLVVEVWTDSDRVPVVISVPIQTVRVVRSGSEELSEAIFGKPSTTNKVDFTSEDVVFTNGDVKLAGTLTIPKTGKAPYPAAVIISGSGGQDRDGAMGVFNLYKLIAEALSNAGVAVLRADDRGIGKSVMPDPKRTTSYRELVNDSRAAFDYLSQRPEIDKGHIALIGHSEGSETALTIAASDSRVAGLVLLAGTAHPIDRVVLEQAIYQTAMQKTIDPADLAELPQDSRSVVALIENARSQKAPTSGPDRNAYFREHLASDPVALAKRVKCPVLIVNGERDVKVLAYNALELANAFAAGGNKQVRLRILPNLTHLFTPVSLEKGSSIEEATIVSKELFQTVTEWATKVMSSNPR